MALNFFRKYCSNVLSVALRFVCNKTYDYGQDFRYYHKTKRKASGKTLEQRLKKFKATCKNFGESELKNNKK